MAFVSRSVIARTGLAVLVAGSVLVNCVAMADDDHAKAPRNVASLDDALAAVQRTHPGRVLKIELEREDEGAAVWVYEAKVLTGAGHVLEVTLDAVSLGMLGVEGGRQRRSNDD